MHQFTQTSSRFVVVYVVKNSNVSDVFHLTCRNINVVYTATRGESNSTALAAYSLADTVQTMSNDALHIQK